MAKFSGRKERKRREGGREGERREDEEEREREKEEEEVGSRVIVSSVCGGASSCVW